ncbi:hypothetical protein FDP41_010772 [Naegleria fowleri]|uniref:Peptidase M16 N-terminal domain-containing protein n=1 Tax=Naegleria fowleri TaxID=5763 RepID=A0A6A5BXH6_NAEFO|nr:uncharacterized protein FDP41_010772 [Naegleria fowleri]KAF0982793.1 hypothetical protein FDP41_010772 [Naegleria fowleri]CAG4716215.1 unnamed protein product [Naegleria fowleri]
MSEDHPRVVGDHDEREFGATEQQQLEEPSYHHHHHDEELREYNPRDSTDGLIHSQQQEQSYADETNNNHPSSRRGISDNQRMMEAEDNGTYLYTIDERFRSRQPNNKRKISNSIIACCTCCCCCIPIGLIVILVVYLLGLFLIAPQMTANLHAIVNESKNSGVTSASSTIRKGTIFQNGLQYVLLHNSFIKNRFTSLMQVYTGSCNEENGEEGIAHMVEHMAFDNSKEFPGRGGVWKQIETSDVGEFNAYTYFRSTVYELYNSKISSNVEESFERNMKILYNQVQLAEVLDDSLETEKGAVLGEARRANNSYYQALSATFENHGGDTFTVAKRFPIGKTDSIRAWKASDLNKFYNKWYKLSNMKLFIVGDFDLDKLETMVTKYWSAKVPTLAPKPQQVDPGHATPKSPLIYLDEINGLNGINFNLMITSKYEGFPRNYNYYRKEISDMVFQLVYTAQVLVKMSMQYPDLDFTTRSAGVVLSNEYPFASKLTILSILTPGPQPELSTWREDFKLAIDELRQIAKEPYPAIVIAVSYALDVIHAIPTYYANTQDSKTLAIELLGNEDPNFEFLNVHDSYAARSQFLGLSFAMGSTLEHVKATAQYLLQGLSDVVDPQKPTIFENVKRTSEISAAVFLGRSDDMTRNAKPTKEEIATLIKEIIHSDTPTSFSLDASALNALMSLSTSPSISVPEPTSTGTYVLEFKDDNLGISIFKLSNGLRVNLKKSDSNMSYKKGLSYIEITSLGGKNSESPNINGACEFVNFNIVGGSRFLTSEKEQYYPQASNVGLRCGGDNIILSAELSAACMNYPSSLDILCDMKSKSYADTFKKLRLSMNPIYNNNVKKKVIAKFQKDQGLEIDDKFDSMTSINSYSIDKVLKSAFPNEHRLHRATLEDFKNLNPLAVQQWVSQHFSLIRDNDNKNVNRFEINIVGDVVVENLLPQLEKWFGTIPRIAKPAEILGYDIYDKRQVSKFTAEYPKDLTLQNTSYTCEVLSYSTNKALVTAIYPGNSINSENPSNLRAQLYNVILSRYGFDVVRSQGGFSYFTISRPISTTLFHNFGLSASIFLVGDYPNYTEDPLNIQRSVEFLISSLKKDISEDFFVHARDEALAAYSFALDTESAWMSQIRGLSITSPATFPSDYPFLRSTNDIDIRTFLKQAKHDDFKDMFSKEMKDISYGLSGVMIASNTRHSQYPLCSRS